MRLRNRLINMETELKLWKAKEQNLRIIKNLEARYTKAKNLENTISKNIK